MLLRCSCNKVHAAAHFLHTLSPTMQGIVNNLRGFHGELMALHEAPGVVAVCKKFTSEPPKVRQDKIAAAKAGHDTSS
jgi:hypothetical protein